MSCVSKPNGWKEVIGFFFILPLYAILWMMVIGIPADIIWGILTKVRTGEIHRLGPLRSFAVGTICLEMIKSIRKNFGDGSE